jgi:hypothetical protein
MPVLTCPFTAIPAQIVKAANLAYPENEELPAELTIKPVAGETWGVEGLSIQFNLKYDARYYANITTSFEALEKGLAFLKQSKIYLESEKTEIRAAEKAAEENFVKEKTPTSSKEYSETKAAIYANVRSVEGVNHEIEVTEKEIKELGLTAANEGLKTPPLTIIARLYARGNELIWTQELTPLRFLTINERNVRKGASGETVKYESGTWYESLVNHVQFDDPITITERENLKLTLTLSGPPVAFNATTKKLVGEGGPEIFSETEAKELHLSQVQAVVNYSRQVAG